jgi:hypothetical protein
MKRRFKNGDRVYLPSHKAQGRVDVVDGAEAFIRWDGGVCSWISVRKLRRPYAAGVKFPVGGVNVPSASQLTVIVVLVSTLLSLLVLSTLAVG